MTPKLYIARTPDGSQFPLPSYTSRYHMGLNLMAGIGAPIRIAPNERIRIPIGFAIGIPVGFCGQIVSEPTLAEQHGIIVSDSPHLIHPADRDPLFVLIRNISSNPYVLHRGEVIAQLVITPALQVCWKETQPQQATQPTKEEILVVDEGQAEEKPAADKFKSFRRHKKSIRSRSKASDSDIA